MLDVIGLGVTDSAQLSLASEQAIKHCDLIIGSERQLKVVESLLIEQQKIYLPPLSQLLSLLTDNSSKAIVVLASGDPLHYGIGRWLGKNIDNALLKFHPAVSSMQAVCHLLGYSMQDVEVVSLHGRPFHKIRSVLKANKPLLVLTDKNSQPIALAQACFDAGFLDSTITVLEEIGYPEQKVSTFTVEQLLDKDAKNIHFEALHVTMIEPLGDGSILPEFPGFEDTLFITDGEKGRGLITKREVRLAILSLLQPQHSDVIWDVGAGCGSIAIELAYWQKNANIFAIEHHSERLACLSQNQEKFGVVENLTIINGRAPKALTELPAANKVFIGGSDGELPTILKIVWQQLPKNGVLVASAVTENTKHLLQKFSEMLHDASETAVEVETLQLAISKGKTLAGQLLFKPNYPVTLYKLIKVDTTKHDPNYR